MKKAIRCITLVLVLCLIFSAAGTVVSADDFVDGSLMVDDYGFQNADYITLQALFLMDARGFIKALAFESAEIQTKVMNQLFSSVDRQTSSTVSYLLMQMRYPSNQRGMTQSEKNLINAIVFRLDYRDGLGENNCDDIEQLLQNALQPISTDQYSDSLGVVIRDDPYSFIVLLDQLEQSQQATIIDQIAQLNGTVRSIPVVVSLELLLPKQSDSSNADTGMDSPGPLEPGWEFTPEQIALIYTILERLKDVPATVEPQEPISEELAQWRANPVVSRTDFYPMLLEIANGGSNKDFIAPMFLETATFVQAFSHLQTSSSREKVIELLISSAQSVYGLHNLLFNIHCYLTYVPLSEAELAAITELQYAALHDCIYTFGEQLDYAQYFDFLLTETSINHEAYFHHLGVNACRFPYEFLSAYTSASLTLKGTINSRLKAYLDPGIRQALIDTLYDLQSDETLSIAESEAIEAFLEYQASTPNPMYPYGVDPNTPPATEPTEPSETSAPTEATEPEESEAATQETSGDPDPAKPEKTASRSHLLSTVLLCAAAFALGIPIGVAVVNRKKRNPKQEEDAVPPAQDEEGLI